MEPAEIVADPLPDIPNHAAVLITVTHVTVPEFASKADVSVARQRGGPPAPQPQRMTPTAEQLTIRNVTARQLAAVT